MLPEETAKDVNSPQYHHDTTQHCCTGCANRSLAQVPLLSQDPLSCTAGGTTQESLKAEKYTGKKVKKLPHHTCDADLAISGVSKAHSIAVHCSWAQRIPLVPRDSCGDVLQALMDPVGHCVV